MTPEQEPISSSALASFDERFLAFLAFLALAPTQSRWRGSMPLHQSRARGAHVKQHSILIFRKPDFQSLWLENDLAEQASFCGIPQYTVRSTVIGGRSPVVSLLLLLRGQEIAVP